MDNIHFQFRTLENPDRLRQIFQVMEIGDLVILPRNASLDWEGLIWQFNTDQASAGKTARLGLRKDYHNVDVIIERLRV